MTAVSKTSCYAVYAVFAACVFLQFSIAASLVSSIAVIAATIFAARLRRKAAGTLLDTHYQWQIRTFWIGGAVYMPIATVIAAVAIAVISLPGITAIMDSGETDPARIELLFMAEYGQTLLYTGLLLMLPFAAWWLYRCGSGAYHLYHDRPLPRPQSWL